jgi:photosystem II stability/assembly factor-like uncharacterized protein
VKRTFILFALCSFLVAGGAFAQKAQTVDKKAGGDKKAEKSEKGEEKKGGMTASTFAGLELRGIGPALTSGRIGDIAVDPTKPSTWYVAVSSGGVWKTVNAGTTFAPIFEGQGSFSIGCVAVDPNNPLTVWVGTGENNSQRSVSYGDGVYKSVDGGRTWENVGLKKSEHIGKILIDPRDSNTVYVAAQGPLWAPGGDRGLYKTTDGGKTWKPVLTISENTGVSDVVMDPRNPDVLYASAYQRRRHVWTLINGGPEAAIHKSTDGGATWKKLTAGLPREHMGRIGLAVAPSKPDTVYAIVEAANEAGGFFRSNDAGANWEKRSDYVSGSPQYYQEIFVDPENPDRIYSMDVFLMVSEDGGKSFQRLGEKSKHVDNHALWIDPANTDHLLVGCDGGIYESWDRGQNWDYKPNLPVTQFYRVSVDNALPFYNVYGGTQDNYSLGGPSRTNTVHGIMNHEWFVTQGGDGFETQVDPEDPNIIYAQSQHGGLVRFDRRSGEAVDIQPRGARGEALRFNWDSPLLISPHNHLRLYHAANRLFQSDDRGNSWRAISPDLTRQIDRRKLKVMGRVWGPDTVAYNNSTSFYGNIVSLAESPVQAGLLYVGTDDGLVQVSEDQGANWRKVEKFPGVPENTYVSNLQASRHDANVVYAAFNNHKMGDFKPYLLKSTDRGRTWTSIAGDLPERQPVWALIEDHANPNLLFAGTEFGLFFTIDGGKKWVQLKGMPVIAVRDLDIQRRENDLAVATFGRGFYILDDYTPLRMLKPEMLEAEAMLFPVKKTLGYIEASPLGGRGKSFQGESFYTAPNPPFGAVFTYHLKEDIKTLRKQRQEAERKIETEGGNVVFPAWDELRAEARQQDPQLLFTVSDEDGNVIRRLTAPAKAGLKRISWDLRFPPANPVRLQQETNPFFAIFGGGPRGPMVAPGTYKVQMAKVVDDVVTPLGEPQTFEVVPVENATLPAKDRDALLAFHRKTARLQRAVLGAVQAGNEAQTRINHLERAILDAPGADPKLVQDLRAIELRLIDLQEKLTGDPVLNEHNEPTPPSILGQVQGIVSGAWDTTADLTRIHQDDYAAASEAFAPVLADLQKLIGQDLKAIEDQLEAAGGPWTPGRIPTWQPE